MSWKILLMYLHKCTMQHSKFGQGTIEMSRIFSTQFFLLINNHNYFWYAYTRHSTDDNARAKHTAVVM